MGQRTPALDTLDIGGGVGTLYGHEEQGVVPDDTLDTLDIDDAVVAHDGRE